MGIFRVCLACVSATLALAIFSSCEKSVDESPAASGTLSLSEKSWDVPIDGGSKHLLVAYRGDNSPAHFLVDMSSAGGWVETSAASDTTPGILTITVSENRSGFYRIGRVIVKTVGTPVCCDTLCVTQRSTLAAICISDSAWDALPEGDSVTFSVTNCGSEHSVGFRANVLCSGGWLATSPAVIMTPGSVTLTTNLNETGNSRSGQVILVSTEAVGDMDTFSVAQASIPCGLVETYGFGAATDVTLLGTLAYVVGGTSLTIVDFSTPEHAVAVGKVQNLPGSAIKKICVDGDYAYVTAEESGVLIVDVSNPTAPALVGRYATTGSATGVAATGGYAFVADESIFGFSVLDVSNPEEPIRIFDKNPRGKPTDIVVHGNLALIAEEEAGLEVFDISNPQEPIRGGCFDTPGLARDVAAIGRYAYVADYWGGIRVVDISDPSNPVEAASYGEGTMFVRCISISGSTALIGEVLHGELYVVDITTPSDIQPIVSYPVGQGLRSTVRIGKHVLAAKSATGLTRIRLCIP